MVDIPLSSLNRFDSVRSELSPSVSGCSGSSLSSNSVTSLMVSSYFAAVNSLFWLIIVLGQLSSVKAQSLDVLVIAGSDEADFPLR